MGFTIGGIRGRRDVGSVRRARTSAGHAVTAVAEYTGLWGWDVLPGAPLVRSPGGGRGCSCPRGDACPVPGEHPLPDARPVPAGTPLDEVTDAWAGAPGAAVLLPVGRSFDALEVSAAAGRRALPRLERLGLPLGPVSVAPDGRAHFFVAPGAAAELPRLLYRMGWDGTRLDLRCLGRGDHLLAPPCDLRGLGPVRWLRPPTLDTAGGPPPARLLLGTLAYAQSAWLRSG